MTQFADPGKQFTALEEGLRLTPYRDSEGHLTVGRGHKLDTPISERVAEMLFEDDYADALRYAAKAAGPAWDTLDPVRRAALVDMAFQMGGAGLKAFRSMLSALRMGDYDTAALECLDSKYAKQTPSRAKRVAEMIRTGRWQ